MMNQLACGHAAPLAGQWCAHLAEDEDAGYHVRFTGQGVHHDLLCEDCARVALPGQEFRSICAACQHVRLGRTSALMGIIGRPGVRTRATALHFEHREHSLPALAGQTLRGLIALGTEPRSQWLAVNEQGELLRLDLEEGSLTHTGVVGTGTLDLSAELVLHVSPCGRYVAVVNSRGAKGLVMELASGKVTMPLDRGSYHEKRCEFPVAFFRDGTRTLLAHATAWNRLDVSDPATGELLTPRESTRRGKPGEPRTQHELDYFHCGLTVSPDGNWLVDDGWVWHPVGILTAFSLRRWVHENVWESEDGPSLKQLRECSYHWDGPLCFVGPRTLAVWGFGGDVDTLLDAAMLFDVETGKLVRWFPGPRGAFRCDGNLLLVSAKDTGTTVWDVETGERLLQDSTVVPTAWHPAARRFLTVLPDGLLRESSLSGAAW
ncbi:WD40 repeat domain-containing protein [Myxococcus sp. CA039A]|uniref:WD40 repeat domain-containing protein n=1 Tax=Myxococcus sp. CA039A TaxID=2741737 RepID=UPI00157ACF4E|nr:hypothetical protein [Myxococcus sp. CA039A]NTX51462.1 hypothetical protein [Myxococcus sp. CA039A]